ncbi:phage tail sheath family protein [Nostoc sp. FACHB-110]|nr:phage tail sheath family protein [Nostoc sp. FACHB-110]
MQTRESNIPGISLEYVVPTPDPELLTGVPVFFGLASPKQGVKQPKKLTLATHFQQYFDSAKGYLADTVTGFFENGGRICYVMGLSENTFKALKAGLEVSEVLEDIDLVCVPDIMLPSDAEVIAMQQAVLQLRSDAEVIAMQQAVLQHCERMGDRFAILDALNDPQKLPGQRQQLISRNAALYAPWLKVESRPHPIPPSGHIAGIYASCDRTVGVHGAPANIPLTGVLDLSFSLTSTEQEQLNLATGGGVNCIRSFQGRGMRVWGVRTLSPIPEWQYVNVRRIFITFGRWVNMNLADTVFEPNAFPLWVRLQRELSVYCESLWQQGALQGASPQEAYYVKCDAETNPPQNRDIGKVIAEIGLSPTVPGEFIQLLLVQSNSGITVT